MTLDHMLRSSEVDKVILNLLTLKGRFLGWAEWVSSLAALDCTVHFNDSKLQ